MNCQQAQPGQFMIKDLVAQDPEATLGIYDLDENERQQLMSMDEAAMNRFAIGLGLNWGAGPVSGVGALDDSEVSTESSGKPGVSVPHDAAPSPGQNVVHP